MSWLGAVCKDWWSHVARQRTSSRMFWWGQQKRNCSFLTVLAQTVYCRARRGWACAFVGIFRRIKTDCWVSNEKVKVA